MENRTIIIANNKTQKRYSIETSATTLGELQDQMTAQGIDFSGMTFTEGISKTQLLTRESLLPTNVMYKGQPTNNLVMLLTNPNKQIASGAMRRRELYQAIKDCNLQEDIKGIFGKNYTMVSNADLEQFLMDNSEEIEVTNPRINDEGEVEVDDFCEKAVAKHPDAVELFYLFVKYLTKTNGLVSSDIAVLANLLTEFANRLKESEPKISDDDIDDMLASI